MTGTESQAAVAEHLAIHLFPVLKLLQFQTFIKATETLEYLSY